MNRRRRLAFSTLGCPGESVPAVLRHGDVGGCTGVELRCRSGELVSPEQEVGAARRVGDTLRDGGVEVVCLASYVQLGAPEPTVGAALERHLELAAAAGAPGLRVFGGDPSDPHVSVRAVQRLRDASDASAETGVAILVETHDALLDGATVARVLDEAAVPTAGAIWDVLNPWRSGEHPSTTLRHLGPWLRHVQFKDARSSQDLRPVLAGAGAVPLVEILELLDRHEYDGWLSLEWEAAWYPDALPLDDALHAFRALVEATD